MYTKDDNIGAFFGPLNLILHSLLSDTASFRTITITTSTKIIWLLGLSSLAVGKYTIIVAAVANLITN